MNGQLFQSVVMGFREGLEAFLVIVLILRYLATTGQGALRPSVYRGIFAGALSSVALGFFLGALGSWMGGVDRLAKAWESAASLLALALVTTFILWMIRHGRHMKRQLEDQVARNLTRAGVFLVSFVMVAREGTEIAIFTFAGSYPLLGVSAGILAALVMVLVIDRSLIRVRLDWIFNVTLAYLILQAGFLLGYSVHEGLSAMKDFGLLAGDGLIFSRAFDLSGTVLNHKDGAVGLPLFVILGWYSRPEWIQFLVHHLYVTGMFLYWFSQSRVAGGSRSGSEAKGLSVDHGAPALAGGGGKGGEGI